MYHKGLLQTLCYCCCRSTDKEVKSRQKINPGDIELVVTVDLNFRSGSDPAVCSLPGGILEEDSYLMVLNDLYLTSL